MFFRKWRWSLILILTIVFLVAISSFSAQLTQSKTSILPLDHHGQSPPSSPKSQEIPAEGTHSSHVCQATPPNPAVTPNTEARFNWRVIPSHHPVDHYVQLSPQRPSLRNAVQRSPNAASLDVNKIASRREAVKQTFQRSWKSYKERAWMRDELAPISGQPRTTQFGGWGATLVDSLDTLWILGMKDEFAEAVEAALEIDFKPNDDRESEINMFEIIIRYLGGFIGAYDVSGCHDARLLNKALEVAADMAYATFDTPNRMPASRWKPGKAASGEEQLPALSILLAEAASASVEFTRLSQITGDMRYFDAISRVTDVLDEQQAPTRLPDMWPINVDMRTPNLTFDTFFGLGAMADSAFEYLPKMHQLLNGIGPADQYRKMYEYAMDTAITHTVFRPIVEDKADILIAIAKHDGPEGRKDDTNIVSSLATELLAGRNPQIFLSHLLR